MFRAIYTYYMQTQRGPTGWSEGFWNNNADKDEVLTEAVALGVYLRNIHSKNALMQTISVREVSNDPAIRTSRRVSFRAINETLVQAAARLSGMYPTTCLRLNLTSFGGNSNYVYLRGMPDDIDIAGNYTPLAGWTTPFNELLAILVAQDTGWARRELLPTNAKVPLRSILVNGVITTADAHGLFVNDRVRIGRTTSTPNVDGVYRVATVDTPTVFTVVNLPIIDEPVDIGESSYVQKQFYQGLFLTGANAGAISKRNVGRPTGGPVGRRTIPRS